MDPLFEKTVPTTENSVSGSIHRLDGAAPAGRLDRVRVEETENNFFEYTGRQAWQKEGRMEAHAVVTMQPFTMPK